MKRNRQKKIHFPQKGIFFQIFTKELTKKRAKRGKTPIFKSLNTLSKRRSVKRHCPGTIKMEGESSTMAAQKSRRAR